MALGSILVRLTMNTADFETDAGRAAKVADKRAKEIDETFRKAGVAIGLALGAAAIGVTRAVKSSIDNMDEMSKSAQRVGMSTEAFSQLAYAGSLADVSIGDLQGSFGRLARSQGDAMDETSRMGLLFKALGIEVKDASGQLRAGDAVLRDFADRYKEMGGSQEIINAGMQVFGRSFQNLIPMLANGSQGLKDAADEADRLGITLSTKTGKAAEEFNDNLTRMETGMGALWQQVAANLLPDMVLLTDALVDWVKEGERGEGVAHGLAEGIRGIGLAAESAYVLVSSMARAIGGLSEQAMGFAEIFQSMLILDWEMRNRGAARYRAGGQQVNDAFGRLGQGGARTPGRAPGTYDGPLLTGYDENQQAYELAREAARIREARERARKLAELLGDPTGGAGGKTGPSAAEKAAKAAEDALKRLISTGESKLAQMERELALYGDISRASAVAYDAEVSGLQETNPLLATKQLALAGVLDLQDQIRESLEKGINAENERFKAQMKDMAKSTEDAAERMSVFADQAARNMQDTFAEFLFDPFADGLDGMVSGFADALRRMLAEYMASEFFRLMGASLRGVEGEGWLSTLARGIGTAIGGQVAPAGAQPMALDAGSGQLKPVSPNLAAPPMGNMEWNVIVNNAPPGTQVSQESGRGPDGSLMRNLVIDIVADDVARGGKVHKATKQTFGLQRQGYTSG